MTAMLGGSKPTLQQADKAWESGLDEPLSDECRKVQIAQWFLAARRLRREHLNGTFFGEPAWDMLLQLYVRQVSGLSSTVSELRAARDEPASTVQRWLDALQEQGLIHRKHLVTGADLVELTAKGDTALDAYLTDVQEL